MTPHLLLTVASSGSIVDLDGTFFIQLGIFTVVAIFLYVALVKPVVRLIDARRDATDGALSRASKMREEAEALGRQADSRLDAIRATALADRARHIEEARDRERELLSRARSDARAAVESARAEMTKSAANAKVSLEREVEAMAASVAARVLGRSL